MPGLLLLDKPRGVSSFSLVHQVRKRTGEKKVGHAGTLDPFATGLMILLVGKQFTRMSDSFLGQDKEYEAIARLGQETDSYDCTGRCTKESSIIPTERQVEEAIAQFQGKIMQTPPMFSAKKIKGQKLYTLARRGIEIARQPVEVEMFCQLLAYEYPYVSFHVRCSKGTYIRSIAYEMGRFLGCGAHLSELRRTRSGSFVVEKAVILENVEEINDHLSLEVS